MRRTPYVLVWQSLIGMLSCLSAPAEANSWLYVSLKDARQIVIYDRDATTGVLQRSNVEACSEEPGVLCASPDRRTLFVALRSSGQLASYRINSDTGELTPLSLVEGGADPCYLLTDERGRFLMTAYYVANKVTVHKIDTDGRLSPTPLQTVSTGRNAHGLAIDKKNSMVFVPHTGANRIYQFRFDRDKGQLRASQPAFVSAKDGQHPRHITIHPSQKWVYANNEAGDSLSVYEVNPALATLRHVQTVASLPSTYDGSGNSTARCEMTPDGRFIYVANRGHDSIAAFAIDTGTGRIRSLGQVPTEKTPRSFCIDRQGKFLFVAGERSGRVVCFRIEPTGHLRSEKSYEVGPAPWCVLPVDSP